MGRGAGCTVGRRRYPGGVLPGCEEGTQVVYPAPVHRGTARPAGGEGLPHPGYTTVARRSTSVMGVLQHRGQRRSDDLLGSVLRVQPG